jgi:hypothetical protein
MCPARAFLRGCDYSQSVVMWLSGSKNFFHDLQLCTVGLVGGFVIPSMNDKLLLDTFPTFDIENGANPAPIIWQRPL